MSTLLISMSIEVKIKTYRRFDDLTGRKFGKLTVISGPLNITEEAHWKRGQRKWLCKCDCGNEVIRITNQLKRRAQTPSCGCFSKERIVAMNTEHCRPFEWLYNNMIRCATKGKREMELTYADFLEFTKTTTCHYCGDTIKWKARAAKKSKIINAYYLDRKDNTRGYTKENCVVCCSLCNFTKHVHFTHDEMLILGKTISEIKKQRALPVGQGSHLSLIRQQQVQPLYPPLLGELPRQASR